MNFIILIFFWNYVTNLTGESNDVVDDFKVAKSQIASPLQKISRSFLRITKVWLMKNIFHEINYTFLKSTQYSSSTEF